LEVSTFGGSLEVPRFGGLEVSRFRGFEVRVLKFWFAICDLSSFYVSAFLDQYVIDNGEEQRVERSATDIH